MVFKIEHNYIYKYCTNHGVEFLHSIDNHYRRESNIFNIIEISTCLLSEINLRIYRQIKECCIEYLKYGNFRQTNARFCIHQH